MKKNVVFFFSTDLGNRTYANHIKNAVENLDYINPYFFYYHPDEKKEFKSKVNPFIRWIPPFVHSYIIKHKYLKELPKKIEALFFLTFELPVGFIPILKRYPTIVACDSTLQSTFRIRQHAADTKLSKVIFYVKTLITNPRLKHMVKHISHFVTYSSWCKKSLVSDYKVNDSNITVAPGGYDLSIWKPQNKKFTSNVPYLLFVGNDFKRKGGEFLVTLFSQYIYPQAKLKVISNDTVLKKLPLPEGVELVQGLRDFNQIINHYQSSFLFVLPTRIEYLGLVLVEASCIGLPLIATDVGGVSEVVKDGINGYLMPYNSSAKQWADKILYLLHNSKVYSEFSKASLLLAKNNFSKQTYLHKLDQVFKQIFSINSD